MLLCLGLVGMVSMDLGGNGGQAGGRTGGEVVHCCVSYDSVVGDVVEEGIDQIAL